MDEFDMFGDPAPATQDQDDAVLVGGDAEQADTNGPAAVESEQAAVVPAQDAPPQEDYFAGIESGGGDAAAGGDASAAAGGAPDEKEDEDDVTFLSVWKEERAKTLEERANTEREQRRENTERGAEEIKKFYEDRAQRIEAKKKENRAREDALRQDLNSTFERGTTWEQVAKMVDLTSAEKPKSANNPERMRTLLIHLRAAKK